MIELSLPTATLFVTLFGAVLAFSLFVSESSDRTSRKWLAELIGIVALIAMANPQNKLIPEFPGEEISSVGYFLLGPLIYCTTRSMARLGKPNRFIVALMIIPAVAMTLFFLTSYTIAPFYSSEFGLKLLTFIYDHGWIFASLLEGIFLILSFRNLRELSHRCRENSSGNEQSLAQKLRIILTIYILLYGIDFATTTVGTDSTNSTISLILTLLFFATVNGIYIALSTEFQNLHTAAEPEPTKYAKTTLALSEEQIIIAEARVQISSNLLWEQSDLTLSGLASKCKTTTHALSQSINNQTGQNFARFINDFRIDQAKELLAIREGSDTILQIALKSGFSSKATFNRVFREIVGETPSEFRKSHCNQRIES